MNTIEKIRFRWKAWRRTLSIEEFTRLLKLVNDNFTQENEEYMFARMLVKAYFRGDLKPSEADVLAKSQMLAQDLWVETMRNEALQGKVLTKIEKDLLVKRLPWYFTWNFPVKLSTDYLEILFNERNPEKIVAYCRDFSLPEEFEKKLLDNYQQSLTFPDSKMEYVKLGGRKVNGWREALETYLYFGIGENAERFLSREIQYQLLMLKDAVLTNKLVGRCTVAKNILDVDITMYLIEQHEEEAVRILLRESFLQSMALQLKLEKELPQLKTVMEIAKCRREIYISEKKSGVFLGALTVRPQESRIITMLNETATQEERNDFAELCIKPLLGGFGPAMSAYIAYHFPQFAEQILEFTKVFNDACRETCRKRY